MNNSLVSRESGKSGLMYGALLTITHLVTYILSAVGGGFLALGLGLSLVSLLRYVLLVWIIFKLKKDLDKAGIKMTAYVSIFSFINLLLLVAYSRLLIAPIASVFIAPLAFIVNYNVFNFIFNYRKADVIFSVIISFLLSILLFVLLHFNLTFLTPR